MVILQNWFQVLESIGDQAGTNYQGTNWYKFINKPVLDLSCKLWAKYPKGIPFNPYARGFTNSICSQVGNPIPEVATPPFTGGQCEGIRYRIDITYTNQDDLSGAPTRHFITEFLGKLLSVKVETNVPDFGNSKVVVIRVTPSSANPSGVIPRVAGGSNDRVNIDNIVLNRVDNQPDNCGDPPAELPNNPPRDPNDFQDTVPVIHTNPDGDEVGNDNLKICIPLDSDLGLPLKINLGETVIQVDFAGISTSDANAGGNPDGVTLKRTLPPSEGKFKKAVAPELSGDDRDIEDELVWVNLKITKKPVNTKTQFGDGGPTVYYCGWFEFKTDDGFVKRSPIHFLNSVYLAPQGASGYGYTVYEGFKAIATAYSQPKPEDERKIEENCQFDA